MGPRLEPGAKAYWTPGDHLVHVASEVDRNQTVAVSWISGSTFVYRRVDVRQVVPLPGGMSLENARTYVKTRTGPA